MKTNVSRQLAHAARGLAMLVLATLATGCGGPPTADYHKLGLVEISGTVTLDGQPLSNASIKFVSPDETYCIGTTDSEGHYTMMLDSNKSGVIPGEKTVIVSSRLPPSEEGEAGADEEDPDAKPKADEKVPACYNQASILKINVTDSDSAMDFDLKSDCSTTTFK